MPGATVGDVLRAAEEAKRLHRWGMGWGMKSGIHAENSRDDFPDARSVSAGIFFNRGFAHVSPVFAVVALSCAFLASPSLAALPSDHSGNSAKAAAADPGAAERRQAASSQFARAEEQRATLNSKSQDKRTLNEYKQVVSSYRRVYLITPHASEVPDSLLAVAELYTEMGDRFGRAYYQSAVDSYQFLMREYPTSRYLQDAYLRSAKLQKDQLGDTAGAAKTYDMFLKKFPHSKQRREAQEARAELALLQRSAPYNGSRNTVAKSADAEAAKEIPPPVISRDTTRDTTREAGTASKPAEPGEDRDADNEPRPVNSPVNGKVAQVSKISAKSAADSMRVIIEFDGGVQYVSGRIANPDRIYFDLHAARLAQPLLHKKIEADGPLVSAIRTAQSANGVVRVVLDVNGVKDYTASLLNNSGKDGPTRLVIDLYADRKAMPTQTAQSTDAPSDAGSSAAQPAKTAPIDKTQPAATKSAKADTEDAPAATAIPEPKRTLGSSKNGKKPDLVQPASAPQPTRDGQSTLTRALGLKIGRIVIDAGHGGHDTGTIGPTGLMEKDLCLDVALRLGKIIQQRLPSADVLFTRSDDTFIPLEERTHIANEARADMFVSIHANSSQDSGARGIETYYLNLKGSPEAMEVAARENATSDQGIHELEDLVKQIARTEKIDESREFAEDVQDSLSKRVQKTAKVVKNRGVRKAPFVVLIGADMPSILTEISFLSNPADEKLLKQPEHRQRVAEGIFQGIAGYLQSLNSMTVNQTNSPAPRKTTTSASAAGASRNRN
ncbi:MAG TPA: N-acetylmuramoyl-L-alanine amidase [Candidatus Eisenbacteria bacterium]|nr:N-acetylmuramoyl-L-alanine amidase [Candidatus Eisenbacteria bacterium]